MNSTQLSFFTLSAYFDTGHFKSACFLAVLLLYVCIVGANLLLILVICVNRTLHEPMYLFLLSLFVNELYGSSGLFPFILVQILSDSHTMSAPLCLLQIFIVYSYGGIEFFNLAVVRNIVFFIVFCPLSVILYTYSQIFRVCFSGCEQSRQKAVATCTPHLASLLNFTCAATLEILQNRLYMNTFPSTLRVFLSLYFMTCIPLFNPLMYGLKLSKIRLSCKNLITKSALH
ncbi:olfactory receptor 49-like [Salarias fasciatus]|uniref:olfactory receptor 49-like n=1 Tax=Salarias fasciatus TaxID=181472 RepID=UPI0011770663|nr:olfactory receptor 49-like [Salarias fasciatus]